MAEHECRTAREWLSAFRDTEALDDWAARSHISACEACTAWASTLARVTRAVRVRPAGSPDVAGAAIEAFRNIEQPLAHQHEAARFLLGVAGMAGLVLFVISLVGLSGTATVAGHFGQEVSGLHAAISFGFLLTAWRPARYGRGLLPVAAMAVLVVLLPSAAHATSPDAVLLTEAAHLPLLVGLTGLLLLLDPARQHKRAPA
jgi:predicted anti-sigma-YlaC factor YlaD